MNNKGIAPIVAIVLVLAGLAVLGGVFYYSYQSALPSNNTLATSTYTPATLAGDANPGTSASPAAPTPTPTPVGASISPTSGPVGTVVTVHGSGFAPTGNTITLNDLTGASMRDVSSTDGKTLTFTVPPYVGPVCRGEICAQYLVNLNPGSSYVVRVITASTTQEVGTFMLTEK